MTFLEDLKRPFNLLSTAIAVVSILLSFYFYFETLQRREPYYLVRETTQIFKRTASSPNVRLISKSGQPIDSDVYLVEISFWNNGKQPIEAIDVRTPLFIELPSGSKIVDFGVSKELKPQISKFRLVAAPEADGSLRRLNILWDHLDPGLGARLQIVYTGERDADFSFRGDILDAEIRSGASPLNRLVGSNAATFIAGLLGALTSALAGVALKRVPQGLPTWRRRATKLLFAVALYSSAAVMFWLLLGSKIAPV